MSFEDDLRQALRREDPPEGFAAKVLARAAAMPKAEAVRPKVVVMPVWRRPVAWAIAAGITVAALIPSGMSEYHRRQEMKAAEAARQLALALDITRVQLQKTRARLEKVSKQHAL